MEVHDHARDTLIRFGLHPSQLPAFGAGRPVAFYLAQAAEGTITVAQFREDGRLRAGIYTLKNVGGGLGDFALFDARARASARAIGAVEIELLAIEVTNPKLKSVLVAAGFLPTTMEAPDELGNETFEALSRVESVP